MLLLIPGPVNTDPRVRAAAAQDYAPWDLDFRALLTNVRRRILAIAGGVEGEHTALPLPGSGHFAIEAAIRTLVPDDGALLVPVTGQYAERMIRLAANAGRRVAPLPVPPDTRADPTALHAALVADPGITHVGLVYSETATGLIHDVPALSAVAAGLGRRVLVDAISAFGALPLDLRTLPAVDCVTLTSNKCLEGLPGLSVSIARVDRLTLAAGRARSWSLDLADLHDHTLRVGPGSHRFTPAAQSIAALHAALDLFDAEGGQPARLRRYAANMQTLRSGLEATGLRPCLAGDVQGPIVLNVHAPGGPNWDLQSFVDRLKARGVLISNFYNTPEPSFRIGCIGAVTPADMQRAVTAISGVLCDMDLSRAA